MRRIFSRLSFFLVACIFFSGTVFAAEHPGVGVTPARYTDAHFDLTYPQVSMDNKEVEYKINRKIQEEVSHFTQTVRENNRTGAQITAMMTYDVKLNRQGIFSFTLTEYTYPDKAAHGMTYVKGLTFETDKGSLCTYKDILKIEKQYKILDPYTIPVIEKKLLDKSQRENIPLYTDFKGLEAVPQEFYFDAQLHLHFIFQRYVVAPYSSGTIDLDMDA